MRRARALVGALALFGIVGFLPGSSASAVDNSTAFTKTETISRTNLVDGADDVVDTRQVTVSVSQTTDLRDRQEITVDWHGAHPTGGLVTDRNSAAASLQEYPVVVMQCRGTDSSSVPVAKRVSPETCWTLTPAERFAYSETGSSFPAYRMDRYASTADRAFTVNQPDPLPSQCSDVTAAHWVPFDAADGTVYPGGNLGCGGLAPEAANSADSLQPGNTTYGATDTKGDGSIKFVIQNADTNASLGCSATVVCSLEVIPIMGISCDAAGTAPGPDLGMPAADRPDPSVVSTVEKDCAKTGLYSPGQFNNSGAKPDLPVTGEYWWAASNWRNRIAVPMTFAPSASVCDVVNNSQTAYVYGSEALLQATQQWAPYFCLNPKLFTLRHVQTSEPQAKNLLNIGNITGAIQANPPNQPFAKPVVEAPTAVSGFAIAYSIDGADGNPYGSPLRLDARLLAKLLTESYRSCADCLDFTSKEAVSSGFSRMAKNPIDITRDPEFQALNPGVPETNSLQSAAALAAISSDSDVMTALTSYINDDPEAREWLDGEPDPWGMVVNPAYKKIQLPVDNWPLLDTHLATLGVGANLCLDEDPVPWLPLVAAPLSSPAAVALNIQFDIANSQVNCINNGQSNQKLGALGREAPGSRFLVGLVSLADADRYQLNTAQLESHSTASTEAPVTDASGRTFVGPTLAGLRAAAAMLTADATAGSWTVPYDTLRTSTAGKSAYPGTFLLSIDVPTTGLDKTDAANYATLLRFVAGPGQTPGLGNGQLPPGYLPMTAANGLGAQAAYTKRAAEAVAAQDGRTWPLPPVKAAPPAESATSHSRSPSASPRSHATTATAGTNPVVPPDPPTSTSSVPSPSSTPSSSPSASPTPTPTSSSPQVANAARTSPLSAGPLGLALPVLALLALIGIAIAGWLSGVGRR